LEKFPSINKRLQWWEGPVDLYNVISDDLVLVNFTSAKLQAQYTEIHSISQGNSLLTRETHELQKLLLLVLDFLSQNEYIQGVGCEKISHSTVAQW